MKCPNDQTILALSHRAGVEIDYCPECRGIWLDRGELDKLLASETTHTRTSHSKESHSQHYNDDHYQKPYRPEKKRKNILGELFDF